MSKFDHLKQQEQFDINGVQVTLSTPSMDKMIEIRRNFGNSDEPNMVRGWHLTINCLKATANIELSDEDAMLLIMASKGETGKLAVKARKLCGMGYKESDDDEEEDTLDDFPT